MLDQGGTVGSTNSNTDWVAGIIDAIYWLRSKRRSSGRKPMEPGHEQVDGVLSAAVATEGVTEPLLSIVAEVAALPRDLAAALGGGLVPPADSFVSGQRVLVTLIEFDEAGDQVRKVVEASRGDPPSSWRLASYPTVGLEEQLASLSLHPHPCVRYEAVLTLWEAEPNQVTTAALLARLNDEEDVIRDKAQAILTARLKRGALNFGT